MQQRAGDRPLESGEARAILFFANAQFLDVATTILGLRSGQLSEANPLAAGLLSRSADLSIALKLLVTTAVLLLVLRFVKPQRRAKALLLMSAIVVLAPLANASQLLLAS